MEVVYMTRLDALIKALEITKENVTTRNQSNGSGEVDYNASEFIVNKGNGDTWYEVLKEGNEVELRLEDLLYNCYGEEELAEFYGVDENGTVDLSSADIDTYLERVATVGEYIIFQSN